MYFGEAGERERRNCQDDVAHRDVEIPREHQINGHQRQPRGRRVTPNHLKTRLHPARRQLRRQLDHALGTAVHDTFAFGAQRCDRVVAAVLRRLAT